MCRLKELVPAPVFAHGGPEAVSRSRGQADRRRRGAIAQAAPSLLVQPDKDGEPTIVVAR